MKKQILKDIILNIEKQKDNESYFNKAINGLVCESMNMPIHDAVSILLKQFFIIDVIDEIYWWVYDDVKKEYMKDDKNIDVSNLDNFIDFLYNEFNLIDSE